MFKQASEKQHHQRRDGSHSTKPRANGGVNVLPPLARPHEERYSEIKKQFDLIELQLDALKKQKEELLSDRYWSYKSEKVANLKTLQAQIDGMSSTRGNIADLARAVGCEAFGWAFITVARLRLSYELFLELRQETQLLMGRPENEVRHTRGKDQQRKRRDSAIEAFRELVK